MKVINPATEEIICELSESKSDAIREQWSRTNKAQVGWQNRPIDERLGILRHFRELLSTNRENLAFLLTLETGKPITQSRNELNGALGRIQYFLESASCLMKDKLILNDLTNRIEEKITYEPLGIVAAIFSWSFPFLTSVSVFAPALITGNAVLFKPSERSSLSGLEMTKLLYKAGVPQDVFVPVIGKTEVAKELLKLPIHAVFFSGSSFTGQSIAQLTSQRLIKTQLELNGNNSVYLCEDINIRAATPAVADGAFYNMGQSRSSVKRIYVHEKVYDVFLDYFLSTVKNFVIGDPMDEKTFIGPLARSSQITQIENQISDASRKGGKLLCGGKRIKRKGYYFEPTVFSYLHTSIPASKGEPIIPLVGIQKVKDDREALELMNDTLCGLTTSIYTTNKDRAIQFLSQMNSGTVYWNCCDRFSPRLPSSGRGLSGLGATLSQYGIKTFLQPKAWHLIY